MTAYINVGIVQSGWPGSPSQVDTTLKVAFLPSSSLLPHTFFKVYWAPINNTHKKREYPLLFIISRGHENNQFYGPINCN